MRISFFIFLLATTMLFSCQEVVKKVAEEVSDTIYKKDSLAELQNDMDGSFISYLSKSYKILERKKDGLDSLYLVERYYTDGKKYGEMWYRNNLRDGLSVFYHPDGTPFFKIIFNKDTEYTILQTYNTLGKLIDGGNLKNGNGKLILYDPISDSKFYEAIFKNKKKHQKFNTYYPTGEIYEDATYINGKINGPFTRYFKNGKINEKGHFINGILDGDYTIYFRSGKIKSIERWKNEMPQYSVEYNLEGNKVKEEKININSEGNLRATSIYSKEGNLESVGNFKNGLKHGLYIYYYSNGKTRTEELWSNDTLMKEKTWYESGIQKSQSKYNHSGLDSIYTEYYSDGKLRLQQQYKSGKKEGSYVSYYSNGQKYVVGTYRDGEPLGKFQYYTKEGVYKGTNEFKTPKK